MQTPPSFTIVIRGYDRHQVEALVQQGTEALASSSETLRASTREALQEPTLQVGLRGYDREQVDAHLAAMALQLE